MAASPGRSVGRAGSSWQLQLPCRSWTNQAGLTGCRGEMESGQFGFQNSADMGYGLNEKTKNTS